MPNKKKSSLNEIGYVKKIPRDTDMDDYEKIDIKDKNGKVNTLYRPINESNKFDETTNFNKSWEVFNNHLN